MAIGEKLRKLRQSLGLTQSEMSAGVVDRSFYSRIENERSSITAEELMKILENQNVSIIKFLESGYGCKANNSVFQDRAVEAYFNNDIHQLKEMGEDTDFKDARAKLALDFLIAKLENKTNQISPLVRRKMKYTFFQVGEMNKDTLWYLLVFMDSYSFDDLKALMETIFNKFKKSEHLDMRVIQLLACIYVNYMKTCRLVAESKHEFEKAVKYLQELPNLPVVFLPKMIGRYFVAIKQGDSNLGEELKTYIKVCGYEKYLHM